MSTMLKTKGRRMGRPDFSRISGRSEFRAKTKCAFRGPSVRTFCRAWLTLDHPCLWCVSLRRGVRALPPLAGPHREHVGPIPTPVLLWRRRRPPTAAQHSSLRSPRRGKIMPTRVAVPRRRYLRAPSGRRTAARATSLLRQRTIASRNVDF